MKRYCNKWHKIVDIEEIKGLPGKYACSTLWELSLRKSKKCAEIRCRYALATLMLGEMFGNSEYFPDYTTKI